MLITIKTNNKYFLLTVLALFNFVIGAQALHPHFHKHEGITHDCDHDHAKSEAGHLGSASLELVVTEHDSCPICLYLTGNSAVEIDPARFFNNSDFVQTSDTGYRQFLISTFHASFHTRGPPSLLS